MHWGFFPYSSPESYQDRLAVLFYLIYFYARLPPSCHTPEAGDGCSCNQLVSNFAPLALAQKKASQPIVRGLQPAVQGD